MQKAVSPQDVLWGVKAIAEYCNRPQRKIYHLIKIGVIPTHKLGRKTRIATKPEIDKALASLTESEAE
jgi:excisionase family DNA binding protein